MERQLLRGARYGKSEVRVAGAYSAVPWAKSCGPERRFRQQKDGGCLLTGDGRPLKAGTVLPKVGNLLPG